MDQKPKGPYKHVERPSKSRVDYHDDNMGSSRWGAVIIILIVIIIALIPIVHKFASENQKALLNPQKRLRWLNHPLKRRRLLSLK